MVAAAKDLQRGDWAKAVFFLSLKCYYEIYNVFFVFFMIEVLSYYGDVGFVHVFTVEVLYW